MTTPEQYREELVGLVQPFAPESVRLDETLGLTLADDLVAISPIPRFDVSAMDGFALRHEDAHRSLRVVADLPAGSALNPNFGAGECVSIMTGAPIPAAADTVVAIERVRVSGDRMDILEPDELAAGSHIRAAGEDVRAGDVVVRAGALVTPGVVSTAAACGLAELTVRRRARVAVAATGDELRPAGTALEYGQIYESNSAFVAGQLRRAQADVHVGDALADTPDVIAAALDSYAQTFDLIVLTGGAGGGAHDVPGQVIAQAARCGSARVAMQPGKPQAWALWNGTPVIVLPGNPIAAAVSAAIFVAPMIATMMGSIPAPWQTATLTSPLRGRAGKTQFIPVVTSIEQGTFVARQAHERGLGSHLVSALATANALARLDESIDHLPAGSLVDVLAFG